MEFKRIIGVAPSDPIGRNADLVELRQGARVSVQAREHVLKPDFSRFPTALNEQHCANHVDTSGRVRKARSQR